MSFRVSRSARIIPTAIAGRARGRPTRQKTVQGPAPRLRAASSRLAAWVRNMARVLR